MELADCIEKRIMDLLYFAAKLELNLSQIIISHAEYDQLVLELGPRAVVGPKGLMYSGPGGYIQVSYLPS